MEPLEKQKLERQAVNGKMCLMFGGIFLIFSALTSTLIYGMGYFLPALEANKGNQEYQELLETNGLQSSLLMVISSAFTNSAFRVPSLLKRSGFFALNL